MYFASVRRFVVERTQLWLQQTRTLVYASFRKNVYKPRQCHAKGVLLHEVGSVSTAETQILGGFYEGLCNAQDRRVRLD